MLTPDQIDAVIAEVAARKGVVGILLCGSYVYGEPTDESDLDVRVITDGSWSADERDTWRFGTRIELLINTPEQMRRYFQECVNTGIPYAVHFWTHGKILLDKTGIVGQLQGEAQELWRQGPKTGVWQHTKDKWKNKTAV